MTNIKDIALAAGVTVTTVSRVLNNHPYVSTEKREAVQAVIRQLNYTPNASAISLKKQKTNGIAVIVPVIDHPFFSALIEGMAASALEDHYHLILCQREDSLEKEWQYLNLLKKRQVDGIIIGELIQSWDKIYPISQFGPVVLCNEYEPNTNAPSIYMNHYKGAYLGMEHLIHQGYKKIAICISPPGVVSNDRERACRQALADHQLEANWFYSTTHSILDGEILVDKILKSTNPPDAIFTGSDQLAAGIIYAAEKQGIRIPQDLAVMGFDNQPIAQALTISTINQPIKELGYKSIKMIIKLINGEELIAQTVELPYTLIKRKST